MNGQEPQQQSGPYFNVGPPQQAQQQQQQQVQEQQQQQAPPPSLPPASVQANKRKGEEEPPPPPGGQRAKRNRYISIACNECKRRKIKCNGENPCHRCGNLELECVYAQNCSCGGFKESQEFRQMNVDIQNLQNAVNDLYNQIAAMRGNHAPYPPASTMPHTDPSASYRGGQMSPAQANDGGAQFQGPTSATYNFDVAKSSLRRLGIAEHESQEDNGAVEIDPALGAPHQKPAPMAPMVTDTPKDPLRSITKHEAVRLFQVYEAEVGSMYPMLDMDAWIPKTKSFFDFVDAARRSGLIRDDVVYEEQDRLRGDNANIIRMVLAIGLTIEAGGHSKFAEILYNNARQDVESLVLAQPIKSKGLILIALAAEYMFYTDEEAQAQRLGGIAVRYCLELGLHRQQSLEDTFPNENERAVANKVFWSILLRDRRWSFSIGRPFAVQDSDIDPNLQRPESHPFLMAMISYSLIASKVFDMTNRFEHPPHDVDFLDYQLQQWHHNLPDSLAFHPSDNWSTDDQSQKGQLHARLILYFRKNYMRMLLLRSALRDAASIHDNPSRAHLVVDIARDTIKNLCRLKNETTIYTSSGQVVFNGILTSALAVLFLAVLHAPNKFSYLVRDEFYQALDIVKGFGASSNNARRVWHTLKSLREVAPKLGLNYRPSKTNGSEDPHSSAALAMAGLAGHPVESFSAYSLPQDSQSPGSSLLDLQRMTNEMTWWFETVQKSGDEDTTMSAAPNRFSQSPNTGMASYHQGMSGMLGHEEEFSRIMNGLM